jgi:hypothetical protein
MNSPQYIPSFYFYKFAQGVSEPYTALQAYRGGAIDQYGNILKAESSIDPLEYLIIKLKKIFDELPPGLTKAKLNNYMSTMQLFGEEVKQIGITDSEYIGLVESYIALHINPSVSYMELCEDMAAGGMGTPGTSTGYNTGSVSGYDPAMGTTKRTTPILKGLDNCEMFDVCPEEMGHFKSAKAWKHVPDTETKNYLQRYQRRNPKAHMAVRSVDPDTGESDLYWINFKPLSFMEEYGLEKLDILNEKKDLTEPVSKLLDPVLNPPKEDASIAGASTERLGKLLHGTRALGTAIASNDSGLLKDVEDQLIDLSGKPISDNKKDAIDVDPKTNKIHDLDIKGHTTTIGQRIDVGEYGEHPGLEDVIEPLRATMRDVEAPAEVIKAAKTKARSALKNLESGRQSQLKDIVMSGLNNDVPMSILPTESDKQFRFPYSATLTPAGLMRGYVEQVPQVGYHLRPSGSRIEVGVRAPDISSQKAQGVFASVAKNLETGKMQSSQIDNNQLDSVLNNMDPAIGKIVRETLSRFIK